MSNVHHLALFLALVVSACFCNTVITAMDSAMEEEAQAGIHIHIALPLQAKPVNFECSSARFMVLPEHDYEWTVPVDKVESCNVQWGHSSASFNAFDPNIDAGHAVIYLMAKLDGFFHSWDQVTWDKKTGWIGLTEH